MRDYLKKVAVALLIVVSAWAASAVFHFFGRQSAPATPKEWVDFFLDAGATLWHLVSAPITAFFASPRLALGFVGAAELVAIAVLLITLGRAKRRIEEYGRKLQAADMMDGLLARSGLRGHWPHAKTDGSGASWADLCAEIERADNNFLHILGANGGETFGRPNSPLYEALVKFGGDIRVILSAPDSAFTKARARDLGMNHDDYRQEIKQSVDRLRTLKQRGRYIQGRYYGGRPNWKMIITNRTMWLQYYHHGVHVSESPVFRFDAGDKMNLYQCFLRDFDRIWDRCKGLQMDLGGPEVAGPPDERPSRRKRKTVL